MAKNKFNQNWIHDHINDPYVKLAQKEGYRARAVYKLKEIDESEKLIRPGQLIVDLGAAPGSWSQYVRNKLSGKEGGGIHGEIFALDLLPMAPVADVDFIQGDFTEEAVLDQLEERLKGRKLDLVLSDMAPNLSGHPTVDAARIEYIMELAVDFAKAHLKPNGALLVKCFHGPAYNNIVTMFKSEFKLVSNKKPKASRDKSSEIFLLGKGLKNSQ
ncbi:RlmE family RNA methyltransferase [Undibacterium squillarum]|uniref:RlmE family RNA methyltransferase n=1 Tax=Undibacterium squillarum TaxID=1131567 RepID=UPI0016755B96|nr:RlmE family RNA methyltransferase [Undibacterium squillarum]